MQIKYRKFHFLVVLPILALSSIYVFGRPTSFEKQNLPRAVTTEYITDDSIFPNPERGFFQSCQPPGGGPVGQQDTPHPPLETSELRALRQEPEAITLIRDTILIPRKYWGKPISQEYLDEIQGNFDAVRAAGLKTAPRFLYDWSMQNRDPDEATINLHLDQLKPLLHKNADVIAWVQGGLFGGSGEQNASDHKYVYDKYPVPGSTIKWQGLSDAGRRLLLKELQLIPPDRMMNVRYPRLKWDLLGWSHPTAMQHARTTQTAYDNSNAARVGFTNDGFMGSPEHYAMFRLPNEAEFTMQDAEFVVHEGETSDASEYKQRPRQVVLDMAKFHISALNRGADDWAKVAAAWKSNGDYDEITRRMGYRYRLLKATLPQALRPGTTFNLLLEMKNDGFSRAFNPRGVEVILRDTKSDAEYVVGIDKGRGNRLWLPGPGETKALAVFAGIPRSMPTGDYEVFLNLPDPYPSLSRRPEYSIRLANKNLWESSTGYNRLLHTLRIEAAANGQEHSGRDFFTLRKP